MTDRETLIDELNKSENVALANEDATDEDEYIFDARIFKIISEEDLTDIYEKITSAESPLDEYMKTSTIDRKEIESTKKVIIDNLSNDLEQKIKEKTCRYVDQRIYHRADQIFEKFLFNKTFVPESLYLNFYMNDLITNVTKYHQYNSYGSPEPSIFYDIPERVILIGSLNDIFGNTFMNTKDFDNVKFKEYPNAITKYIHDNHVDPMKFEYFIIKSMLGKLILALNTVTEMGFKDSSKSNVNLTLKQAILDDIETIGRLPYDKIKISWNHFMQSLLSMGTEDNKDVYNHKNYQVLNNHLSQAYQIDFAIESLLGRCLKCYCREIMLTYVYVVECVYILARLLSIYKQKKLWKNKTDDDIIKELNIIAASVVIIYESKAQGISCMVKSLPKSKTPLSGESRMYFINHAVVSGPYFLLKMLENSVPILFKHIREE